MGLLKKRKPWEEDNVLAFPNMDEIRKVKNEVNLISHSLMKLVKSIPSQILHSELTPISDKDELISVREAARLLGINVRTVGKYREAGLIAYIQYTDRKFMYRKADILSFQNRNFHEPKDYLE
jgi:DNA-binding transcriptional regulator YhcF (GntR family)